MIQAAPPEQLHNPDRKENLIPTVPGFAKPTQPPKPTPIIEETSKPEWLKKIFYWWHKVALIILVIYGLIGLWDSFYFILFKYQSLSNLLELHRVNAIEVNNLISRAIITFVSTFINVLFAIRLSKVKETTANNIDLIVATFLIITTKLIQNFLIHLDLLNYFLNLLHQ